MALPTDFAPAERTSPDLLDQQRQLFLRYPMMCQLLDAVPDIMVVVNEQRQIVFANKAMTEVLGEEAVNTVLGMRPGEALDCVHATETDGGCGTTVFCRTCGAVNAILSSLKGEETVSECRITRSDGSALDLRVWAQPLMIEGHRFSTFAVQDISHEKRRHALERIFFHDILNTAGTLRGFAEVMEGMSREDMENVRQHIYTLSQKLIDEIEAQRQLLIAEAEQLAVEPMTVSTTGILHDIITMYQGHLAARDRHLVLDEDASATTLITDATLLSRVLGNMVKNALEATDPGGTVTVTTYNDEDAVVFAVHNPGFIPLDTQLQIFQRSFSTKGRGRGLGTYSMRLITERYLAGTICFTSTRKDGTTFKARYPYELPPRP